MQVQNNHVFKFIHNNKPEEAARGIKTFPHQTYGISTQSPDAFKYQHTLINTQGYNYKHEQSPLFQYHSQQTSHIFDHYHKSNTIDATFGQAKVKPRLKDHQESLNKTNPYKYHLKKGRLTQFHDKNSWMNRVYLMSGNERSPLARQTSNKERQSRISNLKPKNQYDSEVIPKVRIHKSYYKTIEDIMSEKTRIKSRRRIEAQKQEQIQGTQKSILNSTMVNFKEKQTFEKGLSKTAQEWCPGSKGKAFRKRSSISTKPIKDLDISYNLQEWQRKTSNSIWNKHNYHLKSKNDNEQQQQTENN